MDRTTIAPAPMSLLSPLEFRDCVVDGPHFRGALEAHEKELKKFNKRVKVVYVSAEKVFKAMDQLQQAFSEFAISLSRCYLEREQPDEDALSVHSRNGSPTTEARDYAETDDERVIRTAFAEFGQMIRNVEEARKTMLTPIKQTVLEEIQQLRSVWLSGSKTDPKIFQKDTNAFCTKLEKYLTLKPKEQSQEIDDQMRQDRQRFIVRAFEHVTNIHQAEELKKLEFVQTISLFMQVLGNFYHQAYEQFQDSLHQRNAINQATQRSAVNFAQITLETNELKEKLLKTPWEQIQTVESASFREGYLFVLNKKPMSTIWVKHFCIYKRDVKQLDMIPYVQGRSTADLITEQYSVKSCVRRSSDSIDRRFCFDVEVENKSTPLTLQAQSQDDLAEWLQVMDGQEPQYADRSITTVDPERTFLNDKSLEFLCRLLDVIEKQALDTPGLYRISGVKSKISALICQGLSPNEVTLKYLRDCDIHILTGAVKHFVRHLDEPLIKFELHDDLVAAVKRLPEERLEQVRLLLQLLPSENRRVLRILMQHLAKVASHSKQNNMTSSNLAIVFAPSLMRSREETVAAIMTTKFTSTAIELMIENYDTLLPPDCFPTNGNKPNTPPSSCKIEPIYSTPLMNCSTDPSVIQLSADDSGRPLRPTNPPGRIQLGSKAEQFSSHIAASGDHLSSDCPINSVPLRRIHSASTPGGRPFRLNREAVRRKPAAPPAPNRVLRSALNPTPTETSAPLHAASVDGTQSAESPLLPVQQQSVPHMEPKSSACTSDDGVLPRSITSATSRMTTYRELPSPDPSTNVDYF